jgi:hypothetical protein
MYDSIEFRCPSCGKTIEAQSKSGPCDLVRFPNASVPLSVALDANRHAPFTCKCGESWSFGNVPDANRRVSLTVEPAES